MLNRGNGREIQSACKRKADQFVGFEDSAISDGNAVLDRLRGRSVQNFLLYHRVDHFIQSAVFGKNADQAQNGSDDHTENQCTGNRTDSKTGKSFAETNEERLSFLFQLLLFLFGLSKLFLEHFLAQGLLNAAENDPGNEAEKEEDHGENNDRDCECGSYKNCFLQKGSGFQEAYDHFFRADRIQNQLTERLTLDQELLRNQFCHKRGCKKRKHHSNSESDQADHGFIHSANQSNECAECYEEKEYAKQDKRCRYHCTYLLSINN